MEESDVLQLNCFYSLDSNVTSDCVQTKTSDFLIECSCDGLIPETEYSLNLLSREGSFSSVNLGYYNTS